jgi:hypothetical protein
MPREAKPTKNEAGTSVDRTDNTYVCALLRWEWRRPKGS